LREKQGNVSRK